MWTNSGIAQRSYRKVVGRRGDLSANIVILYTAILYHSNAGFMGLNPALALCGAGIFDMGSYIGSQIRLPRLSAPWIIANDAAIHRNHADGGGSLGRLG